MVQYTKFLLIFLLKCINYLFLFILKIEVCKPKDNDACLQSSDGWSTSYTCENSKGSYCESWAKDMRRCCPESCKKENPENTLKFTEEDCNKSPGDGTCTYPNKAQCTDGNDSTYF